MGPPPRPAGAVPRTTHFEFRFDQPVAALALAFGITPRTTGIEVGETDLRVRFGIWSLQSPLTNITDTSRTGPYALLKVAGPPHLSFTDRGVTFATTTEAGVCVRFAQPVPAIAPLSMLRHPGATLTVAEPDSFIDELEAAIRRVS